MDCYRIEDIEKIHLLIESYDLDILTDGKPIDSKRLAFVYSLPDGRMAVVTHQNIEGKGVIFQDELCYNEFLRSKILPLDNPNKVFWEEVQPEILNFQNPFNYFASYINAKYAINIHSSNRNNFAEIYKCLLNSRRRNAFTPNDAAALFVMGAEIYRKRNNGRWLLIQESSTYNPFFKLAVLVENNEYVDLSFYILNHLRNNLEFNDIYFDSIMNAKSFGANLNELSENGLDYIILK